MEEVQQSPSAKLQEYRDVIKKNDIYIILTTVVSVGSLIALAVVAMKTGNPFSDKMVAVVQTSLLGASCVSMCVVYQQYNQRKPFVRRKKIIKTFQTICPILNNVTDIKMDDDKDLLNLMLGTLSILRADVQELSDVTEQNSTETMSVAKNKLHHIKYGHTDNNDFQRRQGHIEAFKITYKVSKEQVDENVQHLSAEQTNTTNISRQQQAQTNIAFKKRTLRNKRTIGKVDNQFNLEEFHKEKSDLKKAHAISELITSSRECISKVVAITNTNRNKNFFTSDKKKIGDVLNSLKAIHVVEEKQGQKK